MAVVTICSDFEAQKIKSDTVSTKPLNYSTLADIEQEEKEAPGKFLDRLREALRRFTEIDPESEEGKVILKDRFLTQSAPDIHRKLQKRAYGQNQILDTLLQLAQMAYYGREYEEKKETHKKTKEKAEAFAMAMKNGLKQPEKNAQRDPGEKGWACYVAHSSMSGLQRTTLEERLPSEA